MQETKTQVESVLVAAVAPSPSRAQKILVATMAIFLALGIAFFVGPTEQSPVIRAANSTLLLITPTGTGTGVVIHRTNPAGEHRVFLWTAAHVAAGSDAVARRIFRLGTKKAGFSEFPAILIARNEGVDLALYWVVCPADASSGVTFARAVAQPGEPIFHIGNFRGDNFDNSLTTGVVSQVGVFPASLPGWPWPIVDQCDAICAPGGSGGGVFNSAGEVVGIMVGGAGPGVSVFVPTRVIWGFAQSAGLGWAVYGNSCPPDAALVSVAVAPPPVELPEVP